MTLIINSILITIAIFFSIRYIMVAKFRYQLFYDKLIPKIFNVIVKNKRSHNNEIRRHYIKHVEEFYSKGFFHMFISFKELELKNFFSEDFINFVSEENKEKTNENPQI